MTLIHKSPCLSCPSHNDKVKGIIDEEMEEIKKMPKELIAKEYLFACYKRPSKLCKGLCDNHGIDEQYLKTISK